MQIGRRGRNGPCWCSSRHRNPIGSRHGRSSAQVDPKANGATASRKGCRRPAEPNRVVSRRDVDRCLSCLHRKVPEQFLGEGVLATAPPYPTGGIVSWSASMDQPTADPESCRKSSVLIAPHCSECGETIQMLLSL